MTRRDYQKQKVYDWENEQPWNGKHERKYDPKTEELFYETRNNQDKLSKEQVAFIVQTLNKRLNESIKLKFVKDARHATYCDHTIKIPLSWASCWSVVLHEYAHGLTRYNISHGAEFVQVFCTLLRFCHPNKPTIMELANSLNDINIDFASLRNCKFEKKLKRFKIDIDAIPKKIIKEHEPKKLVLTPQQKEKNRARGRIWHIRKKHPSIQVEKDSDDLWFVYASALDEDKDPYNDNHYCTDIFEILEHVTGYANCLKGERC